MDAVIDISVIVPVVERYDDVAELYGLYKKALKIAGSPMNLFTYSTGISGGAGGSQRLIAEGEKIKVIKLSRWFGRQPR